MVLGFFPVLDLVVNGRLLSLLVVKWQKGKDLRSRRRRLVSQRAKQNKCRWCGGLRSERSLYLIKDQIRNKVKNKYKNETSFYCRLKTRSAVVAVEGTGFVVSFGVGHKEVTKVETLKGEVKFANLNSSQSVNLSQGMRVSYVVETNSSDVFSDEEISEFVIQDYMTPVHKMTATEIKRLDWEIKVTNKKRQIASAKKRWAKFVCRSPQAELNQCYWVCQNNPKGEKHCRTDLPQVNCLRRCCNANGVWAGETRLPANFYDQCFPERIRVGPCND